MAGVGFVKNAATEAARDRLGAKRLISAEKFGAARIMRLVIVRDGTQAARYDAPSQRAPGAPELRGNDVLGPSTTRSSGLRVRLPREGTGTRQPFPWRRVVPAALLVGALGAACTLGLDDYEPALIERETLQPEASTDAGADAAGCDSGLACCEALPCADGTACLDGVCGPVAVPALDAGACGGADCTTAPPVLLAPSCTDGTRNGDEVDVDCGGSCERRCQADQICSQTSDCAAGLYCPDVLSV